MAAIDLPELRTGALRLRPPAEADVAAIALACQDPEIQRRTTVPSPYTPADARGFVGMCADALQDGSAVTCLVVDADDRLLGTVGVRIARGDRTGEVGYWVAAEARGRGVATGASRLLSRFALDELGLGRLQLVAAVGNTASNRVATRLGFTHEGTLRQALIDGPTGDPTAPRSDANVYGLLPGELR